MPRPCVGMSALQLHVAALSNRLHQKPRPELGLRFQDGRCHTGPESPRLRSWEGSDQPGLVWRPLSFIPALSLFPFEALTCGECYEANFSRINLRRLKFPLAYFSSQWKLKILKFFGTGCFFCFIENQMKVFNVFSWHAPVVLDLRSATSSNKNVFNCLAAYTLVERIWVMKRWKATHLLKHIHQNYLSNN